MRLNLPLVPVLSWCCGIVGGSQWADVLVFVTVKKCLRELKGRKDFFFFGHGFRGFSLWLSGIIVLDSGKAKVSWLPEFAAEAALVSWWPGCRENSACVSWLPLPLCFVLSV